MEHNFATEKCLLKAKSFNTVKCGPMLIIDEQIKR